MLLYKCNNLLLCEALEPVLMICTMDILTFFHKKRIIKLQRKQKGVDKIEKSSFIIDLHRSNIFNAVMQRK